jgi:hypothetical protein
MSETSNEWTGPTLLDLMSYVEDTPANPSASPVRVKAKKTRGTSGHGYDTPLAFYDPVTQSLKMYEATCPLAALPSLEKLPPSGIAQNGVLFLRPLWEPITDATGSSLLHTPTAKMNQMAPSMKSGWWPTARANRSMSDNLGPIRQRILNGKQYKSRLEEAVALWPTPRAGSMYGGSGSAQIIEQRYSEGTISEEERRSMRAGNGGKLNPTWVEWLMGFPTGWTDLEDSETPSSHK